MRTRQALLPAEQLSELLALWEHGRELISEFDGETWGFLKDLSWDWAYPESIAPMTALEPAAREALDMLARRVFADLVPLAAGSPGLVTGLERLAKRLGFELDQDADPLFELLYPEECFDEDERREQERSDIAALKELARRWRTARQPSEVAQDLLRYEDEATKIGHQWPRRSPDLCRFLARRADHTDRWVAVFLDHQLPADLLRPFLQRLTADRPAGWEDLVVQCLELDSQAWGATRLVLQLQDPPAQLLEAALARAPDFPQLVEALCQRREVPAPTVEALLCHRHPMAALATAVGEWNAKPEGQVTVGLLNRWRKAILSSARMSQETFSRQGLAYWLRRILSADSELALEWVKGFLDSSPKPAAAFNRNVVKAVDALKAEGRIAILERLEADTTAYWLIPRVVDRQGEVYRKLLELKKLEEYHLRPLSGPPDAKWVALARQALAAGHDPRRIAQISFTGQHILEGYGVEYWREWGRAYSELEEHSNEDLRTVARYGRRQAQKHIRDSAHVRRKHELNGF